MTLPSGQVAYQHQSRLQPAAVNNLVLYLPRVTQAEEYVHKYAPNTMITMMHKEPSPFNHNIYMSVDATKELAIPVITEVVTVDDLMKGSHVMKSHGHYYENLEHDRPGIDKYSGDFRTFSKIYPIDSFDFPTIYSCKFADGTPLRHVVMTTMDSFNLLDSLIIDRQLLTNYLVTLESGYSTDAPYHNAMHACDVVISMGFLIRRSVLVDALSDVESNFIFCKFYFLRICLYISCCVSRFPALGVQQFVLDACRP